MAENQVPEKYAKVVNSYLEYCVRNNGASGTIDVKRTKLQLLCQFLDSKDIPLSEISPANISDFMITLSGYSRSTIHIFCSVLSCFFRYLQEKNVIADDMSPMVPRPRIYTEEGIPETWTPEEVHQLLSAVDRSGGVGKRDYAMILLAVVLGMRAGDICGLRFQNLDWNRRLICYVQQKTNKSNELPILPEIGEAIIDYLKYGRLDSDCDNVFIRHIPPYCAMSSSSTLSESIKRYMRQAGLTVKKRKAAHSLRHTLASNLLHDGTPLMTISNVLGHYNPRATAGYIKVDIAELRKCSLSFGSKAVAE